MASIINMSGGRKSVQFSHPEGGRPMIRLGRVPLKQVQTFRVHVERLVSSLITGDAPPDQTSQWLAELPEQTRQKLVRAGLVPDVEKDQQPDVPTLGAFLDAYRAGRTDLKAATLTKLRMTRDRLVEHFGADISIADITPGHADEFRIWLVSEGLADATIRKFLQNAKAYFRAAVRRRLLTDNPFDDQKATMQANEERAYFVTRQMIDAVIAKCPDTQWKLLVALSRYGGLRCPSEHLALRWGDIDWQENRIIVTSPKTERHPGGAYRVIPLFPELRPHLDAAWQLWQESDTEDDHVISMRRSTSANLRTRFKKIIRRAGLQPWPKLFHNLRASRETELADEFPIHTVCKWIGNSTRIAQKHYLQVTEEHFDRATGKALRNALQKASEQVGTLVNTEGDEPENRQLIRAFSHAFTSVQGVQVGDEGLEPPTSTV